VDITGCGLCQTKVPCEFEVPKLIQKQYLNNNILTADSALPLIPVRGGDISNLTHQTTKALTNVGFSVS
jgi:hypothetical protein